MKPITNFIFKLLLLFTLVDSINGFVHLTLGINIGLSQFYKLCLIFMFLIYFVKEKQFSSLILIVLTLIFSLLHVAILWFVEGDFISILNEFRFSLILIFPILSYLFFKRNINLHFRKIRWIIVFNFLIVAFNMLIGLTGIGKSQYEENIGSIGFFIAGNELSGLILILSGFLLYYCWNHFRHRYVLFSLLLLFLSLIKSTKTAILGELILISVIPLIANQSIFLSNFNRYKLIKRGLLLSFFSIGFMAILIFTPVAKRWSEIFSNKDLITAITSSRNIYLNHGVELVCENFTSFNYLLGYGFGKFQNQMADYVNLVHTIEIDFFDVLFCRGIISTLFIFGFYAYVFLFSLGKTSNKNIFIYSPLVVIMIILLLLISFFAGHIITSGMCGLFLGFLFSLSHYEQKT